MCLCTRFLSPFHFCSSLAPVDCRTVEPTKNTSSANSLKDTDGSHIYSAACTNPFIDIKLNQL